MNLSLPIHKQVQPPLLTLSNQIGRFWSKKEKVVVVMGATGTGKSRLSIDIASRLSAEVINSDKIQVYHGLDIATNKITDEERREIPHHLLGVIDPNSDFSAANYRSMASASISSIISRGKLPIIVGGSNSLIENLIDYKFQSKYDCCFLWVDVVMPVLHSFVSDRVDRMVERGMIEEAREFYAPDGDYSRGIRKAIGVPELDRFFRVGSVIDESTRGRLLTKAIDQIKMNTSLLAVKQLEKIHRLRRCKGWRVHRLDATDVFTRRGGEAVDSMWEELVAGPGADLVRKFMYDSEPVVYGGPLGVRERVGGAPPVMAAAIR